LLRSSQTRGEKQKNTKGKVGSGGGGGGHITEKKDTQKVEQIALFRINLCYISSVPLRLR